ncbi:MAG: hypothetical protein HQL56_08990 [Magnetococcales bacterium]|nr:hypothetical protein [Magnetococcales bacterium]
MLLQRLASLKLTLGLLLWFLATLPFIPRESLSATLVLGVGTGLFAVNFAAFLAHSVYFRSRPGLLLFHAALGLFALLLGLGRLTWMEGSVEVATGESFEGELLTSEKGPLHDGGLERVRFVNEGFTIRYAPGLKRGPTRNTVSWRDERGREFRQEIGDDVPLILRHYRFYTTSNKGFAPVFRWQPLRGEVVRAALHLPSYPLFDRQINSWTLPGDDLRLTATLNLDEDFLHPEKEGVFELPRRYTLEVSLAGSPPRRLAPGESLTLPQGRLTFEGLTTWMGYRIHYDRTRSWLLATVLVGLAGLAWHFRGKFRQEVVC